MPSPQNEEEAAYVSFALLEALIWRLIDKNAIFQDDIKAILLRAIDIIEATPKNSNSRLTGILRSMSFDQKGFEQS
jgi:hypothetical protein